MYTKDVSILLYIYLHTDRLGSDSAVTDGRGEARHILSYMPYGETLLDLSHTHYETPYQFTGYEKDQETGLHYAEARYYDSWLSIFNSTDPMWYKYPHLSPYTYCSNNPIMRIDPTGMYDTIGVKNNTNYGVMVVLPTSYNNDRAVKINFQQAKKQGLPIMLVDGLSDFADGMKALSDNGITVNSYSINQHGSPGYTSIGDEKINSNTDFSILKSGLRGKCVFLNSCAVTRGKQGETEGVMMIQNIANQTHSFVVSADHLTYAGIWINTPLNEKRTFREIIFGGGYDKNDFHLAKPYKDAYSIYNFFIRHNGTFVWNVYDNTPYKHK